MRTKSTRSTPEQNILYNALNVARISYIEGYPIETDMVSMEGHRIYLYPDAQIVGTRQLVIQVDGKIHRKRGVKRKDDRDDRWLAERGWRVMRFTNSEIRKKIETVIAEVSREIEQPSEPMFVQEIARR